MYIAPITLTKKQRKTIEAEIAKGTDFWFRITVSHMNLFSRTIFVESVGAQPKEFRQVRNTRFERNIDERTMHVAEILVQELKEKYPEAKFTGIVKK